MKLVLVTLILAALAVPKKKGIRTQIQEKIKERDYSINNFAFNNVQGYNTELNFLS